MTKSFRRNIKRTITKSLGRYFAIMAIIALGVGFFAGLKTTKPSMLSSAEQYINTYKLYDLRVLSTIGFTKEDVEQIQKLEGVSRAEGAISSDLICVAQDGSEKVLKAYSVLQRINEVELVAGRNIEAPNECVVDALAFGEESIGQQLRLSTENNSEDLEQFAYNEYTIVGIVKSPLYLNSQRGTTTLGSGTLNGFLYLLPSGFEYEYYNELYLSIPTTGAIYSDEYNSIIDVSKERIEPEVRKLIQDRFDDLIHEGQVKIEDAKKELNTKTEEANEKLADAKKELEEAKSKLDTAKDQLEDSKQQLEDAANAIDARATSWEAALKTGNTAYEDAKSDYDSQMSLASLQLEAVKTQLEEGEEAYRQNLAQYEESKAANDAGVAQYESQKASYEEKAALYEQSKPYLSQEQQVEQESKLSSAKTVLDQTKATLDESKEALAAGKSRLEQAKSELDSGRLQYETSKDEFKKRQAEGEKQLADSKLKLTQFEEGIGSYKSGQKEYESGVKDYEDGIQAYEESLKERDSMVEDANQKIEELQAELDSVEKPEVYLFGRDSNTGYASFENDSQIVEGIAKVFPVFFFLIAALVCSTTMTRMIDDERSQIGTFFALGYSKTTILFKYLIYSGSAAIIGCLLGFAVGSYLFPKAIWKAYQMIYRFGDITPVPQYPLLFISLAAALLCSAGTTYAVCRNELRNYPANLIRPKAPEPGKRILLERIGFVWKRMKFLYKVSARNIFRFKKRMIMMILGISGCTALVLTGFGISDSISNIANYQFGDIMQYDLSVMYRNTVDKTELTKLEETYSDKMESDVLLSLSSVDVRYKKNTKTVYLIVTEDETIQNAIHFTSDGENVAYPSTGNVVLTQKLASLLDAKIGDTVEVGIGDEIAKVVVSGLTENYVYNYVYMNRETYETNLGRTYEPKTLYITVAKGQDAYQLAANIGSEDGVMSVNVIKDLRNMVDNMMSSLDYVVLLVIACAGALAFVVLFNLGNINISERVREIATIKVLGFHSNETGAYVFRENLVLSIMGIIVGLPLGILLHRFVMNQIQLDMVTFKVIITPSSFLYTIITVLAFTLITDLIMRRKIERIDMTESLKSME